MSDEWLQRDAFTQGIVILNIKNAISHGVKTKGTAAQTWTSLTSIWDAISDLGLLQAEQKLRGICYTDGGDLNAHFIALRVAWKEANTQGANLNNVKFRMIVMGSMPKAWSILISTLYDIQTADEVIIRLTLHGSTLTSDQTVSLTVAQTTQALSTHTKGSQCDCICSNCKQHGHSSDKCFRPGGGMEGQFLPWWNKQGGTATATAPGATPPTTAPTTAAVANTTTTEAVSSPAMYAFSATSTTRPPMVDGTTVSYANSVASEHFFIDRADFITYTPCT